MTTKSNRTDRAVRLEVTIEQFRHIQGEAKRLDTTISNYLRRAVGLPDVRRGQRADLAKRRTK